MKKIISLIMFLFSTALGFGQNTTLTGTFSGPATSPTFNGVLQLQLYMPGAVRAISGCGGSSDAYILPVMIAINISGGNLVSPPAIWGADCLLPAAIPYKVVIRDTQGNVVVSDYWLIEGTTFDIGQAQSAAPTVPSYTQNMVYPPAGIPNSLGTSWGTSYLTVGSGNYLVLNNNPTFIGTASGANATFSGTVTALDLISTSLTPGNCVQADSSGKLVSASAPCNTGGGGGGINPSTGVQLAYYAAAGTTISALNLGQAAFGSTGSSWGGLINSSTLAMSVGDTGAPPATTGLTCSSSLQGLFYTNWTDQSLYQCNGSTFGAANALLWGGIQITGTPTVGMVPVLISSSTAQWQAVGTGSIGGTVTAPYLPEATGSNILGNSPMQDTGSFLSSTEGLIAPSFQTNGSTNGFVTLTSLGTPSSGPPANSVQLTVPNSVTAYALELPGVQPPDSSHTIPSCTAANPSVCSWVAMSGSGGTYFEEAASCSGTSCTLTHSPVTFLNLDRNGLGQRYTTDFTVSGTTLTLVVAAGTGDVFYAQYYY